jgi:hypothetical protein
MKFTTPPNKNYRDDIKVLETAIKNNENISFAKFCDGEWSVICNKKINNKEFWFDPDNKNDQLKRQALIDSFQYKNPRYFVGITCVNIFGLDIHLQMTALSGQDQDHLTWADIWVNSNYRYYLSNILPIYKKRDVVLFCNENSNIEKLPFRPYLTIPLKNNAWEYNWDLVDRVKDIISAIPSKDMLFLFCCGPFGNILCHELTKFDERHTYLDIGSTLNPFLGSAGFERDYYMGNNYFSNMTGVWNQ